MTELEYLQQENYCLFLPSIQSTRSLLMLKWKKLVTASGCAAGAAAAGAPAKEEISEEEQEDSLSLATLVVWFREFITIVEDDAVGGGGDGSWGSRPSRLLRVIDQRVGCAEEAVQLVS